jgi:alpha-beta hydrolase superfamily lysophospholipase
MSTIAVQHTFRPSIEQLHLQNRTLALYRWPLPGTKPKATVLLVHGLGEHAGRYNQLAFVLNQAGYATLGYDQIGHGLSTGVRGDIEQPQQLVQDLQSVVTHMRPENTALVLLGHSMGGLVVARTMAEYPELADAVILSSPALGAYTSWIDKLLLAFMPAWFPHVRVNNKLPLNWLSRDAQVVREYRHDKWVHRKISALLADWIISQGEIARAQAEQWHTPALLLYAGQDRLVDPRATALFAKTVPAGMLQAHCFNVMYHEIFNDPEKNLVFAKLTEWLDKRYA